MTANDPVADENWAPLARASREALNKLDNYGRCRPCCLPGEADWCGCTFEQHAAANLATLKALTDHYLNMTQMPDSMITDIYEDALATFRKKCCHEH